MEISQVQTKKNSDCNKYFLTLIFWLGISHRREKDDRSLSISLHLHCKRMRFTFKSRLLVFVHFKSSIV